jgi:sugar phosphate isomerase/epimerase
MRIGGCSFAFGPRPLEEAGEIVRQLGFEVIDLGVCLGNTQINPFEASEDPEAVSDRAKRTLERLKLQPGECFVLDFGQPINHPDQMVRSETRRRFRPLARFASLVGCPSIMLIPGVTHEHLGREASYELSVQELRELCLMADDSRIQLNIEPCEPSVAQTPQDAARLCRDVSGLGLTLDYSHFIDPGYLQADVETLHPLAKHFHARQAVRGKRVEAVERGSIDFQRILSLLKRDNYQGIIAVEYVDCETTRECGVDVWTETPKMKSELERLMEQ